ncbi:MAG TPA: hypothetical protein VEV82_06540 [Actinomycetota bacterium]|nr:hypothetical protein [Actinomycetota bacterium]
MRRVFLLMLVSTLLGSMAMASGPSGARRYKSPPAGHGTTLERTIVGEGRDLEYAHGRKRVTRRLKWKGPGKRKLHPLVAFKHLSDIHVIDEESPARVEFLDECSSPFNAAYRPQEAMTL